jgi:large subunit ribosomal protein L9
MEVILLERIHRLGNMGDVVKVRDGFARNFLIPQKKALRATEASKKEFEAKRAEIEAKNAASRATAETAAKKYENLSIALVRQASEEGKLYGSVTLRDIADVLKNQGFDVTRSQIVLKDVIKTTGSYTAFVQLHPEVQAPITVNVVRNESEAPVAEEDAA